FALPSLPLTATAVEFAAMSPTADERRHEAPAAGAPQILPVMRVRGGGRLVAALDDGVQQTKVDVPTQQGEFGTGEYRSSGEEPPERRVGVGGLGSAAGRQSLQDALILEEFSCRVGGRDLPLQTELGGGA